MPSPVVSRAIDRLLEGTTSVVPVPPKRSAWS